MKPVMPRPPVSFGSVSAIAVWLLAVGAFVMNRLVPFRTECSSPSLRAVVLSEAASDPASGSVRQKEAMYSPLAIFGRYLRFCSSVPSMAMVWLPIPTLVPSTERHATDPLQSSAIDRKSSGLNSSHSCASPLPSYDGYKKQN